MVLLRTFLLFSTLFLATISALPLPDSRNVGLSEHMLYDRNNHNDLAHTTKLLAHSHHGFTNPDLNSYKRLIPGFEAPVNLAWSARPVSASVRIPTPKPPQDSRLHIHGPDAHANAYLSFAACLMAGLDGIRQQCDHDKAKGGKR